MNLLAMSMISTIGRLWWLISRVASRCALINLTLSSTAWASSASETSGLETLLAPAVAIALALVTRRVLVALGAGACVAWWVAAGGVFQTAFLGLVGSLSGAIFDVAHLQVSAFSLLVAASVGLMVASGGTSALVAQIERVASGRRGAMVATWLAGLVVFFDDYANCIVVGNAMGPLADRNQVSRAKLAYIVDSTAAPIASLALVSTWVGYEVDLLDSAVIDTSLTGFSVFLQAIPYRFYSLFTLVFVGTIAFTGLDFGPMLAEEVSAARRDTSSVIASKRTRAVYAYGPIAALLGCTLVSMLLTGAIALGAEAQGAAFFEILGASDPYLSMVIGSLVAVVSAATHPLLFGDLDRHEAWASTKKATAPVLEALVVLYVAWTLVDAIGATGADGYLGRLLSDRVSVQLLPAGAFLVAAGTAFATGTSFGTMGILIPLLVPLSLHMAPEQPFILHAVTGGILGGACLGDHASPISDTTLLSALGADVDVVTHTRTQLPYALSTGLIALLFGCIPAGFGVDPLLSIGAGSLACVGLIVALGGSPSAREV